LHDVSPAHLQHLLHYHERLLRDGIRNAAFRRALAARIRAGHRVLDVGTGSGLWAVVAARLGAARVVAIEREPLLRPVIERLLEENGVADRVELITADSRDVRLRREFDLVVSETVGNLTFDEDIVHVMAQARSRWLAPGGAIVPETVAFRAAPVALRSALPRPARLGVRFGTFRELLAQMPRYLQPDEFALVARPRELVRIDLRSSDPARTHLGLVTGAWRLDKAVRVDGIAVWLQLGLAPGISLDSRRCESWRPTLLPIESRRLGRETLTLALEGARDRLRWSVTIAGRGRQEEQTYCPEFAFGALRRALSRTPRRA
jgi:type II protein arginine methyltransferase